MCSRVGRFILERDSSSTAVEAAAGAGVQRYTCWEESLGDQSTSPGHGGIRPCPMINHSSEESGMMVRSRDQLRSQVNKDGVRDTAERWRGT